MQCLNGQEQILLRWYSFLRKKLLPQKEVLTAYQSGKAYSLF